MANPSFDFKQFSVRHDKCGMKVGTDGVLLGAWCATGNAMHILDIGTGSGLVALMLAQRSKAQIAGIEIDEEAASQAERNFETSPWNDRLSIYHTDILSLTTDIKYDLIVSNPPYFDSSLQSPDQKRTAARHTETLTYTDLLQKSVELLAPKGRICLIIPADRESKIDEWCKENNLFPTHKTYVLPKPDALPKRILVELSQQNHPLLVDELVIELSRHQYSADFITLTQDFYLKM